MRAGVARWRRTMARAWTTPLVGALLFCFTLGGVCLRPVLAQGTGQIEGVVRDEQRLVLPGVALSLRNADSGVTRTVVSESDGRYVFPALLPRNYVISSDVTSLAQQVLRDVVMTIRMELK